MASWPERLAEGQIVPYFQPILSVETRSIAGYEALGRHVVGGQALSLGPLFRDPPLPSETTFRRDVDRRLRKAALVRFAQSGDPDARLFLNVNPRLMVEHLKGGADRLPWTLEALAEQNVDPRRIVIELTEEAVGEQTESLRHLVDVYRRHGCTIAVDDVGAEASNLDRIGFFEPEIIKVDAAMLRRSLRERSFRQVLVGVRSMAEGLGATLLFEGVEGEDELDQALEFGARYLQGWYFARAEADFRPRDAFLARFEGPLERFAERRVTGADAARRSIRETMESLGRPPVPFRTEAGWDWESAALEFWGPDACRLFLTDKRGFQVSPNYERAAGRWVRQPEALGRYRAMRPYFPGTGDARWSVSEPYFDSNDRRLLRTYSRPADGDLFLFVDVPEIEKRQGTH